MDNHLGTYIQQLRQGKGLTTRQLGSETGYDHSFISRLEAGQRSPSLDRLWQMIEILGGDFGRALFLLCLDSGVPEEVARRATAWSSEE